MVLDAWEHAYYLRHENVKAKYIEAVWNLWDWTQVAQRFEAARLPDRWCRALLVVPAIRPISSSSMRCGVC